MDSTSAGESGAEPKCAGCHSDGCQITKGLRLQDQWMGDSRQCQQRQGDREAGDIRPEAKAV